MIVRARIVLLLLLPVLLAALSAAGALAATVVVPDDYTTIQQAIDAVSAGDTVYVRGDTYYENLTIGKALTLRGEDRDATIINGGGSGNVVYASADYVTIEGLTLANGEHGIELIADLTIDHFTIRNSKVRGNTYGLYTPHNNHFSYHTIENCIFSYNSADAIYGHQFGYSLITNCEFFENGYGINVGWGQHTTISGNIVHDNTGTGIHIDSGTYNTIEGNELYGNDGAALSVGYVGANNTFRENIVRNNGTGIYMGEPNVSSNLIYNNHIVGNTIQGHDEQGDNFWDNGSPSGGNFWEDYVGTDIFSGPNQDIPGADGFGDTPYAVNGAGIDRYPLYAPVSVDETSWGAIKRMHR